MNGIRLGVAAGAAALMMLAASATFASADTVQLSNSCKVTTTLQGGTCTVHKACPDRVHTTAGVQDVLGCVASAEVLARGTLTGILRAGVKAHPDYAGSSPGPRVRAGCHTQLTHCRARTDGQNIGNGGSGGPSDIERAKCNTTKSLGLLSVTTKCVVYINAVTAP